MGRSSAAAVIVAAAIVMAACGHGPESGGPDTTVPTSPTTVANATTVATDRSSAPAPSTAPTTTEPETTRPGTIQPGTIQPETTVPPPASMSTPPPSAGTTAYVVPSPESGASWADEHSAYPATDIFVPSGCGGDVVSPVSGTLLEVRRENGYDAAVDNPATRGGRSIAILGDDGVRYYLAHFAEILPDVVVGGRFDAGTLLGVVGDSGRTSACHIHFGISPPCPGKEWSVRRGVVWPYPYLDAWRDGVPSSPAAEVAEWVADHPSACADAALDPNAPDA